jgi:excisionase family DNA binding protein
MNKIVCGSVPGMPPARSERLDQLLALLVDEHRREEYERSGTHVRKVRPDPPDFLDLTPYAHLSDAELSAEIGLTSRGSKRPAQQVVDERSGLRDSRIPPGRTRCEAGVKWWALLRCHRSAIEEERWCRQHHPAPPPPLHESPRLHPWDVSLRPDGPLLRAVYELSDRVAEQTATLEVALARLDQAETREARLDEMPQNLLNITGLADYLGLSRQTVDNMVKEHRIPFVRISERRVRFERRAIDDWLTKKTHKPVR